jgi:hypothetical protein
MTRKISLHLAVKTMFYDQIDSLVDMSYVGVISPGTANVCGEVLTYLDSGKKIPRGLNDHEIVVEHFKLVCKKLSASPQEVQELVSMFFE